MLCAAEYGVMHMQTQTIGQRIRHLRKENSMTQETLAMCLHVSNRTVSSWELDRTKPDYEIVIVISELFAVSLSYLIAGN